MFAALETPTDAMIEAGQRAAADIDGAELVVEPVWRAMLRAALSSAARP